MAAPTMERLIFGRLTEAWAGEASDFTPLLAAQLDALGEAIGVDLASLGQSEVPTAGDRRIDIVAHDADGSEFVVENQYGRGDHDHLTRGLAYAVARRASASEEAHGRLLQSRGSAYQLRRREDGLVTCMRSGRSK